MRWTGVEKSRPNYDDGYEAGRGDRLSIGSPGYSFREGRDDIDSRDLGMRSETPDEKVRKFDDLLKRIEAERTRTSPYRSSSRGVPSTPSYGDRERPTPSNVPSSGRGTSGNTSFERSGAADVSSRSFADRARELRMSSDRSDRMSSLSPTPHERHSSRREVPSPSARDRHQSSSTSSNGQFKLQVVEQFHTNLSTAYDTISSLESEVRALKKQLTEKNDSISSLERRNKTLNETVAVSEAQVHEAEQENKKLIDTNKELSRLCDDEVRKLTAQCENHKEKVVALERRNAALNETVAISRDQANKAEAECRKLEEENQTLTKRYDEHVDELTAECDSYKKHADEIKQFSAECDATVKELLQEKKDVAKKHAEEMEQLTSEYEAFKNAADQVAGQVSEFEQRAVEFENTIKELNTAKEVLQSTVSERDRTIKHMEKKVKQLEDELDDGEDIRAQAEETKKYAKKLETELKALKEEQAAATKENLDTALKLEAMTDVMEKTTARITEKDEQIQVLKSTLSATENESVRAKEKTERLMTAIDETRQEIEDLIDKCAELEQHVTRANNETEAKTKEVEELRVQLTSAHTQLNDLQQDMDKKVKRFERYEKQCYKEQESISALERAIEELAAAHEQSGVEITRLEEENQHLTKELSAAQKESDIEVMKVRQENCALRKDLDNTQSDNNEVITKLQQEKQTLQKDLEAIKAESGAELLKLKEEIESLSKELDTAQTTESHEIIQLQKEIETLSSTLNEAEEYMKMYMNDMTDAMKLKSQMREIEDNNNDLSAQLTGKEAQIVELKKNEEKLSSKLATLKLALEEKESELKNPGTDQHQDKKEGKGDQLKLKELESKLATLEKRYTASEEESNEMKTSLQGKLDSLSSKLKKREQQLESSKEGLANAQNMILKLVKTVEELRRKLKDKDTPRAAKPQKK